MLCWKQVLSQEQKYAPKLMCSSYKWMQMSMGLTRHFPTWQVQHVSFPQKKKNLAQLIYIMRNGWCTLADCLVTSCNPTSISAKNRGLPVDTVPQKLQKTKLCETPSLASETWTTLLATLEAALLSLLWLPVTCCPETQQENSTSASTWRTRSSKDSRLACGQTQRSV